MTQKEWEDLPELKLYRVDAGQISRFMTLFTQEAVTGITIGEAFGMIAVEDHVACGAICMSAAGEQESMLELVSLYVVPEYRRRGVATTLLIELMEQVFGETDGMVHQCRYCGCGEEDSVRSFLQSVGFVLEEEETAGSFFATVGELEKAPLAGYHAYLPDGCTMLPLEKLSALDRKKVLLTLQKAGVDDITAQDLETACQECSFVVYDEKKELNACAIFSEYAGSICLVQFYLQPGTSKTGIRMLQNAWMAVKEKYGPDMEIEIPILTDSSLRLMQKLLGTDVRRLAAYTAYFEI